MPNDRLTPAPILFVDHATALGGAEIGLLALFDALDRRRFAPHLATRPGRLVTEALARGVKVHAAPLSRLRGSPRAPWRWIRGVLALRDVIRAERIAVVSSVSMRASVYAAPAARLTRRPFVWYVQDVFVPGAYVRTMCGLSTAVVTLSAACAAPLPCTDKIRMIPLGVVADDYGGVRGGRAAGLRAAWRVPDDAVLIGQVARLQPWKGQRDVLAAAALLGDLPNAYTVIVGGNIFGDARAYEEEIAATARGVERVVLTGHRDDVPAVLEAIDILVHASDTEPFGRILIEAGAAGRPIVAYGSGGVPEIVAHEQTGLVVRPYDPTALAAALRRLIMEPALRQRLGDAARAVVRERFDLARMTGAMEEVFARAVASAGPIS